ncbi:MAG: ATP-binding protein [Oligoflexia bacterium]|nr:ATP-binding protein [Oligoflexia bacterium]
MLERFATKDLKKWYKKKDRMPLIIRGARQVGKTALVRLFAKGEDLDLIELNLEKIKFKSIHLDQFDIHNTLDEIQLLSKKKIKKNSLIFIDEIQNDPKMIQILRYFYEEKPTIAVIAAGSLLEFAIKNSEYSFPVGRVEFYYLGPMSFGEFLNATNNQLLMEKFLKLQFNQTVHDLALELLKKYLYIGGMPKAVKNYVENKSILEVREIQEEILETYQADFPKYKKRINLDRITRIFRSTCFHLGEKVIWQKFDRESSSKEIRGIVELLIDARVLLPAYHCEASGSPLRASIDESIMKLFFLDVGLMNCFHKIDYVTFDHHFFDRFITNGLIAEQFVAQHLAFFQGARYAPELNYWLRDKGTQKGEVDFLIQYKNKIFPIEVKSSSGNHSKSIFYFSAEKKCSRLVKLTTNPYQISEQTQKIITNDQQIKIKILNLPLYAVEVIEKALENY